MVDRVANEASDTRVRMRSAWLGSGSCGIAGPVNACWRVAGSVGDIGSPLFSYGSGCSNPSRTLSFTGGDTGQYSPPGLRAQFIQTAWSTRSTQILRRQSPSRLEK
jgi:hypothetical protein